MYLITSYASLTKIKHLFAISRNRSHGNWRSRNAAVDLSRLDAYILLFNEFKHFSLPHFKSFQKLFVFGFTFVSLYFLDLP